MWVTDTWPGQGSFFYHFIVLVNSAVLVCVAGFPSSCAENRLFTIVAAEMSLQHGCTLMVLLGLCNTVSVFSEKLCKATLPKLVSVSVNRSVFVLCPSLSNEATTFYLFKNRSEAMGSFAFNSSAGSEVTSLVNSGIYFHVNPANGSARFSLSVNSSGIYYCEARFIFPPPYTCIQQHTMVLVDDVQKCPDVLSDPEKPTTCFWWLIGCSLAGFYSAAITIIAIWLFVQKKLKKKHFHDHDYTNMRDYCLRARPLKRVQHPTHQGKY
ncbi:T-cell-specific surface glycoprotein CD28 homolog [Denticeps clupeoides]|uniref:T-cell-specific surface glycoprotein CD28 homolog n=1 Tax=Denticeps clupeoides TaxID=299321 RepID=UPI0010A31804|nr:T-cell-specific surface glycoprotein CD28 homolog [Denticeps clupeoides]